MDLLIKNAHIVRPDFVFRGHVYAREEKVRAISRTDLGISAKRVIDAAGKYLLPGLIDTHVHLGSSQEFAKDCETETRAAASGGVTCILSYLKTAGSFFDEFEAREQAIKKSSLIDIAFHGMIMDETQLREIPRYVKELGIRSFKLFMAYKGKDAVSMLKGADDGFLYEAFTTIKKSGGLAIVHAENGEIISRIRDQLNQNPSDGLVTWNRMRPNFCEEEATRRAIFLARTASCPLLIAHVSIKESLPLILKSKALGYKVFAETCPHYLALTDSSKTDFPSWGKVNPPLRKKNDVLALWDGLKNRTIDVIGSDHLSITKDLKGTSLWSAPPGLPGISITLPILLSEGVGKNRISLQDIARVCSLNPARIFGLFPGKGLIDVGFDADFVLVDLNRENEIRADTLDSHSDFSPYEGLQLKGSPELTISRGAVVYSAREHINPEMPRARYLRQQS